MLMRRKRKPRSMFAMATCRKQFFVCKARNKINSRHMKASIAPSLLPQHKNKSADALTILPLSDLHLTSNPTATQLLLENREYLERMDYVVLLGDQVGCYGTDYEYSTLNEFLQYLNRPYTAVNGNHEF